MSPITNIQAVLFSKKTTKPKQLKLLNVLGLHPVKPAHITENYIRYRIKNPRKGQSYKIHKTSNEVHFILETSPGVPFEPLIESTDELHKYIGLTSLDGKLLTVPFGSKHYEQYQDKALGVYKNLDHHDQQRREEYQARHGAIVDKRGVPFKDQKTSSSWWSWHLLW